MSGGRYRQPLIEEVAHFARVCKDCGALVVDRAAHDRFHAAQDKRDDEASRG